MQTRNKKKKAIEEEKAPKEVESSPTHTPKPKKSKKGKEKEIDSEKIVEDNEQEKEGEQVITEGVQEEKQGDKTKKALSEKCKKQELKCVLKHSNYSFEYGEQRGIVGKSVYCKSVILKPKVEGLEEKTITEGSCVQLYPETEWWVVVLIHHMKGAHTRCMLHVYKRGQQKTELEVIATDSVSVLKAPKHYNEATTIETYSLYRVRHELGIAEHKAPSSSTKTSKHTTEIGLHRLDKDLLVGILSKLDAVVAEQASLKEEVCTLCDEIRELTNKLQNAYFDTMLQANRMAQEAMVQQAKALGQH